MLSPSSPLSALSRSPSPPPRTSSLSATSTALIAAMDVSSRYPSPSSSSSSSAVQSGCASPLKLPDSIDMAEIEVRTDGQPPAKRRKVTARKPRTTEHLDLDNRDDAGEAHLDRLLHVLRTKKKIVVIAGAGISVSAGIPDFRSSEGLFRTLKDKHKIKGGGKALFDASVYKDDKSTAEFHNMVRDLSRQTKEAKPTAFHHMLATIAHEGRLLRLYTQNVDCLDTALAPLATTIPLPAKKPWPVTIQVHGGLEKMQCTKCSHVSKFDGELFQGPEPPLCGLCKEQDDVRTKFAGKRSHGVGRLRPRMVLYNEYNPDSEAIGSVSAADLKKVPDAVIVVGTSLKIPGVKRLVQVLCRATRDTRDGFTAWVNLDPEPQAPDVKDVWDLVVRGKSDDIATLLNLPHWDCEDVGPNKEEYMVSGSREKEERYEQRLNRDKLDVLLAGKKRSDDNLNGIKDKPTSTLGIKSKIVDRVVEDALPTPSASPRHGSPLPRKALPQSKTKQSTLDFSKSVGGKEPGKSKPARKRAGRANKENKPKNEITKPDPKLRSLLVSLLPTQVLW
ncbi:DHS-like NAD/FAD-binding domain-containing protein [Coniella lustricola]|uniref:DHS-like NAD/FAD-binding domain-containing protein n=1 Tax=Coniella lustricola TaxID=2025994 RepID=A0A2T3AJ44_9PEZI|nr:DHS-like NAD/FAD-binding domain-containing protein [Coniella lustricola]